MVARRVGQQWLIDSRTYEPDEAKHRSDVLADQFEHRVLVADLDTLYEFLKREEVGDEVQPPADPTPMAPAADYVPSGREHDGGRSASL